MLRRELIDTVARVRQTSVQEQKAARRAELARDVAQFLADGGEIVTAEPGVTATRFDPVAALTIRRKRGGLRDEGVVT